MPNQSFGFVRFLILTVALGLLPTSLFAENRKVVIMPTTDSTSYGLAESLQYGLGVLYQEAKKFDVYSATTGVQGFTAEAIQGSFQSSPGDILSFVYLEESRISVFLFDRTRPSDFIVSWKTLTDNSGAPLNSEFVETQFRSAFTDLMAAYDKGEFQQLPGSEVTTETMRVARSEEMRKKAEDSRTLFRELAAMEYSPLYMGAGIGMSRFAASGSSASTVNLGLALGYRFDNEWSAELGADVFSYAVLHAGPRYTIPLADHYVKAAVGLDIGSVAAVVTQNRGFASSAIETGSLLVGPALTVDIPLLGATLRADIRAYFGGATILLGTYGIVYNL